MQSKDGSTSILLPSVMIKNRGIITQVISIALFVALMTVCAWIKVPVGPVPVTLNTFAIFLAIGILGTKMGTIAIASYVALGLMGAPIFAGFAGGPAYLLGPSGGYIIGYIICAAVSGKLVDRFGVSTLSLGASFAAGLLTCYAFGTIWFMTIYGANGLGADLGYVMSLCVVPFIIPDMVKIALAISCTKLSIFVGNKVR